jgi:glycosyltransferase involved in cell wall biosynthesis
VKLLLFAKYPPIEGGTSSQTLVSVGLLAAAGHDVDIVTNAAEAEPGYRAILTAEDTARLTSWHGSAAGGSVTVHNTTPLGETSYIPWANPYASKLFGRGMELVGARRFDAVIGWYWEPYGLVAGQVAETAGLPLILRHAGSDVGRLARHPDLRPAYRWLLQRADHVLTGPRSHEALIGLGADPTRLRDVDRGRLPDYFSTPGAALDVSEVADAASERFTAMRLPDTIEHMLLENLRRGPDLLGRPVIGIYGKVARSKGSYDLVSALELLAAQGVDFTLLGAVGGHDQLLRPFLERVASSDLLRDRALLLPYLAPWRIPSLLDACLLVCLLERRFDVALHRTRLPEEVLRRGRPLVLSGEVAGRLSFRRHLADGTNYIRVEDPTDVEGLARTLGSCLSDPAALIEVGRRGAALAVGLPELNRPDGPAAALLQVLAEVAAAS